MHKHSRWTRVPGIRRYYIISIAKTFINTIDPQTYINVKALSFFFTISHVPLATNVSQPWCLKFFFHILHLDSKPSNVLYKTLEMENARFSVSCDLLRRLRLTAQK